MPQDHWTPTEECFERLLKAGAHIEDLKLIARRYGVRWRESVSDESYRLIHERMAEEYLDMHPETSYDFALERTALEAYDEWRMAEEQELRGKA